MKLSDNIGNTPLIKITDKIYAKAELLNPTGSIKDRPASYIINDAEMNGLLKKGDTIIEATSGNMGISFAWLAAERGYNCKIVMPSNMSEERKQCYVCSEPNLLKLMPVILMGQSDYETNYQKRTDGLTAISLIVS
jgi:cysteine synthase